MSKSWYSITCKSAELAEISIYEEIGFFGITAKQFLSDLKAVGDRRIKLRLNSPGGEVFEGLAIFNRLREHRGGVEVQIDGLAASMASVIAMAGAPVKIAENALIMIHNPAGIAMGDAEEMRETADLLDKVRGSLITAYERKTGLSAKKLEAMMDAETWLNASEALALGFVDEVTAPLKMAARFDTRKFRNAPPLATTTMIEASILTNLAAATGQTLADTSTPEAIGLAISALVQRNGQLEADIATARTTHGEITAERDRLKLQFSELETVATKAQADLAASTALAAAHGEKITALESDRTRLEALCLIKGIDPKAAVPPGEPRSEHAPEDFAAQYEAAVQRNDSATRQRLMADPVARAAIFAARASRRSA